MRKLDENDLLQVVEIADGIGVFATFWILISELLVRKYGKINHNKCKRKEMMIMDVNVKYGYK